MQPSNDAPWKLAIAGIRCNGLQQLELGKSKSSQQYYLVFSIRGTKKKLKTEPARGDSSTWNEVLYLDVSHTKSSLLHIEVYAKNTIRSDKLIGEVEINIGLVPSHQGEQKVIKESIFCKSSDGTSASITFTVSRATASDLVSRVKEDASRMRDGLSLDGINKATDTATASQNYIPLFAALVGNLGMFVTLVDKLAEIHPYAKCAWMVLSVTYKVVEAQKNLDNSVKQLVEVLNDVYEFIKKATDLNLSEDQHRQLVAERLAQQTMECAYFIQEYTRDQGFWTRTRNHFLDGSGDLIANFKQNIANLKHQFLDSSTVNTELIVVRMDVKIDDLKSTAVLDDMEYTRFAQCSSDKACLPGTRVKILKEVVAWVNSEGENVPRVFWLTGVAGSGKSAIAHTIAHMFQKTRQGTSFSFDASKPAQSQAKFLFTTLSRNIADLDSSWRTSLVKILDKSKALRSTSSVAEQFEHLFLEPCQTMSTLSPVVLVIDALDECCDKGDVPTPFARKKLLEILSTESAKLPPNFRILLTSRRENDIHHALDGKRHVLTQNMEEIENTREDIEHFVRSRLQDVDDLNEELPNEGWLEPLVKGSEDLFQWAYTACSFIAGENALAGSQPIDTWKLVLDSRGLDGLYQTILDRIFQFKKDDPSDYGRLCRYRKILGRVLDVRQPLPLSALNQLRTEDEPKTDTSVIVAPLGSLLQGASETDTPIQPLHSSFREFITDEKRSGVYSVSAGSQDTNLALACLRVMQRDLRFNICSLKTSDLPVSEVHNLETRIQKNISTHLRYACHFWASHLQHVPKADVIAELRDFLSRRLLFWMEVMGLTDAITAASRQVSLLQAWVPTTDSELVNTTAEVTRLIEMSAAVVVNFTPHLYLSILSLLPASSIIATQYLHRFPRRNVVHSTMTGWPSTAFKLLAHIKPVTSVAFSPDGERIVSGSWDKTICVWDARTGEVAAGPFEGCTKEVSSVAFSPDGERIVSGSVDKTICVWNAHTGEVAAGPFQGHTNVVSSVAFSPDGKRIVSGSYDKTICMWDAHTGEVAVGPFEGHTNLVTSVAFSPDGERIVSGSWDKTICVWDVRTGDIAAEPFQGHTSAVVSVAYSPDGERIVSGSVDETICVWNAHTGEVAAGPFQGHTNEVSSVAFSPDGERIVSGSYDNTIRVWDARTGEVTAGPFEGHASQVLSVAFSPNGERIVSGSRDKTVCVWDACTGEVAAGPFEGHTSDVLSVAFSPDGERIVSGSWDTTIRVWDVQTGEVVAGPFEGHSDLVESVAFSSDGQRIVSGSRDKTIRVWDVRSAEVATKRFIKSNGEVGNTVSNYGKVNGQSNNVMSDEMSIPVSSFSDTSEMFEGWIIEQQGVLFWVPPDLRVGLLRPSNICVIGRFHKTTLDTSHFVHGTDWAKCYDEHA